MGLRQRDKAAGLSAGLLIGIIFGGLLALAIVWVLETARVGGMGVG